MAHNVEVSFNSCDVPELALLPVTLHKMHDNPPVAGAFQRQWSIRPKETIHFDLLGSSIGLFFLFRTDGDPASQTGPAWMLNPTESAALAKRAAEGGVRLTVKAVADPPIQSVKRDYMLSGDRIACTIQADGPVETL